MNDNYEIQENFVPFTQNLNYTASSTWKGGNYFVYELVREPKQNIKYYNEILIGI